VICAGGGDVPVVRRANESLIGVEAVIDKDHAGALLAKDFGADEFLMLTDVNGVYVDRGRGLSSVPYVMPCSRWSLPAGPWARRCGCMQLCRRNQRRRRHWRIEKRTRHS
jgi:carbamate kinase